MAITWNNNWDDESKLRAHIWKYLTESCEVTVHPKFTTPSSELFHKLLMWQYNKPAINQLQTSHIFHSRCKSPPTLPGFRVKVSKERFSTPKVVIWLASLVGNTQPIQNINMERLTCFWLKNLPPSQKRKLQDKLTATTQKNPWNLRRKINSWWSPPSKSQPLKATKDPIHMLRYQKPTMKVPTKHADTACQADNKVLELPPRALGCWLVRWHETFLGNPMLLNRHDCIGVRSKANPGEFCKFTISSCWNIPGFLSKTRVSNFCTKTSQNFSDVNLCLCGLLEKLLKLEIRTYRMTLIIVSWEMSSLYSSCVTFFSPFLVYIFVFLYNNSPFWLFWKACDPRWTPKKRSLRPISFRSSWAGSAAQHRKFATWKATFLGNPKHP